MIQGWIQDADSRRNFRRRFSTQVSTAYSHRLPASTPIRASAFLHSLKLLP
uniref:Uncharacterized protein n=1 Tax=Haemonchus contortus TaxID=6289 RepID=A0A7I4Z7E8_HAECO